MCCFDELLEEGISDKDFSLSFVAVQVATILVTCCRGLLTLKEDTGTFFIFAYSVQFGGTCFRTSEIDPDKQKVQRSCTAISRRRQRT